MTIVVMVMLILAVLFIIWELICAVPEELLMELPEEDEEMFKPICYGAEGRDIMEIQQLLKEAGSTIKVNGKYTIGMLTAVKCFQKKNGLAVTGKIDLKTMNKLKTYSKPVKPVKETAVKKAAK